MAWKIVGVILLIWLAIYVIHHPDVANLDMHNAWHALFGSAGG